MEPKDKVYRPMGKMIVANFVGGIAWGLGVTVGLSIVFAGLGYLGAKVNWVPVVGKFVNDVTKSIDENRPAVGPKKVIQNPQ